MADRRISPSGRIKLYTGLVLFGLVVAIAVIAPMAISGPADLLTSDSGRPPTAQHPLGTNDFGQDILARTLVATRLTLIMTLGASVLAIGGGLIVGLGVWSYRGIVRTVMLRILETAVAYPSLVLALIIAAILSPGTLTTIVAIGVAGIPGFARMIVNQARRVSNDEYVTTARLLGVSAGRIAVRHLLPNMAEALLVISTTIFGVILVEISALSFIGLGVQSPDYDFGLLLNQSLASLYTNPAEAVAPSVMIVITGIAVLMIGDALAERANPRNEARAAVADGTAHRNPLQADPGDDSGAVVEIRDLRVLRADGTELVRGVDLDIRPGEIVGLVGESGSGKSLTAMSVAGLLPDGLRCHAESLRTVGQDMQGRTNPSRLATAMGIVYQDPGTTFSPALRMRSQLTEVLRVHMGLSFSRAVAHMTAALGRVGIAQAGEQIRAFPYQWSGGMKQRAMIAGALAVSPKLIIADEPTTALDVTVQLEVLRQLKAISADTGAAMLFISHDIGVVQAICDRVCVMRLGQIIEVLSARQLRDRELSHPYTKKLVAAVPTLRRTMPDAGWDGRDD